VDRELFEARYQLASGYDSTTQMLFETAGIRVRIEAKGFVEFFNTEGESIYSIRLPETGGRGVYEDVVCSGSSKRICLQFPVYRWIDNYPHCDGEYDRWDTKIVDYHTLTLDLATMEVTADIKA